LHVITNQTSRLGNYTRGIELLQTNTLASKCKSIRIARNIRPCGSTTTET